MIYVVTENRELFNNPEYQIIGIDESLSLLEPLTNIGLDTETDSLDCHTGKLLSLQLGCFDFQIVIDCTTININHYKSLLESENKIFIGWNLKFDLKWFYKNKIVPYKVYDGYLAEKLMWLGYPAGQHSMSLKSAAYNYLEEELDKTVRGQIIYKGLNSTTIKYAADDVKYLEQIKDVQYEFLQKKGLTTAIEYENKFVLVLAYVEYCGVKLDVDKWKQKMFKDNERMQKALDSLNEWLLTNEPDSPYIKVERQGDLFSGFNTEPIVTLNWNSAKQVIPILKKYGVEVSTNDKNKGGLKDSIDAKVLKPQKSKCSLIPLYLDYKEATKVTSTYGENILNQINPDTGRLYTNYNQLGADTTRITSGGDNTINFLNLPSDAETRACFVAEKGNKWISIDYSGQESVILASVANDKAMIDELTYGSKDLHSLTAYMSYTKEIPRNTPIKDIKKKYHHLRQAAKGVEFAINYGGTATTIAQNSGIPLEEANKIYNDYMSGFSGVKKYQDFCRKDVMQKGYILINPLTGHKAFIHDYQDLLKTKEKFNPKFWDYYREIKTEDPNSYTAQLVKQYFKRKATIEKQSINYRIQGTGSMCLRVSLINFFSYLRKENLLFKVLISIIPFDEANCEAPEEVAEEVANKLYECMVKAGAYFCTRCKLDAEISRDEQGNLPTYWIH